MGRRNTIAHEAPQHNASCRWNIRFIIQTFTAVLLTLAAVAGSAAFWRAAGVIAMQQRATPIVIAHRGDASRAENSLAAVEQAARNGADYAEIDVRLTKDGSPVVFHDSRTGRLSLEGRNVAVSNISLRALQRMPMYSNGMQYRVPTLRQMFAAAQASNIGLLLDVKAGNIDATRIAWAISRETGIAHYDGPVMAMSSNRHVVERMRQFFPQWTVGYCASGKPESVDWDDDMDFVVLRGREMTLDFARDAREHHMRVFAGSVGDSRMASYCLREGVDGMLGDDMSMLQRSVTSSETKLARMLDAAMKLLNVHIGRI